MNQEPPPTDPTSPSLKEKPSLVSSLGIILLCGSVVAFTLGVLCASTVILLLWPGTYFSFTLAIIAGIKAWKLLGKDATQTSAPKTVAILQIANFFMVLDFVNLALGITILLLLNSPDLQRYFGKSTTTGEVKSTSPKVAAVATPQSRD